MFRKLILSGVIAAATLTGLAITPSAAEAAPYDHGHHRRFEVLVRHGHHWHVHGVYHSLHEAERVAHHLRHEGFHVRIQEC